MLSRTLQNRSNGTDPIKGNSVLSSPFYNVKTTKIADAIPWQPVKQTVRSLLGKKTQAYEKNKNRVRGLMENMGFENT